MTELWQRLQDRKLVQWALAYAAAAFALVQGVDMVAQRFDWPGSVSRASIIVSVMGFFATLVLAWFHGERGQQKATTGEIAILSVIALAGAALAWRFAPVPEAVVPTPSPTASTSAPVPKQSIAVLPFADLSPGKDQEYFSDGMAEELLNALAKVKGLKVAGRTSAFSFKGKNEDLRTVARSLSVAHVLEGSVRKQGDKVRITAQLIQADDGYHLWSETYDGDLKDVFALQERIARAITEQLKGVLAGPASQPLVKVATTSPEAYALYLQASSIFNRREGPRMGEAIAMLERAVALDPRFARAEARLASLIASAPAFTGGAEDAGRADDHAMRATALDPTLGEPYAARAQSRVAQRKYVEAWPEFERALALEPDDVTANFAHASFLIVTGYSDAGTAALERVLAIDPLSPNALFWRGLQYLKSGDLAGARRSFELAQDQRLQFASVGLGYLALVEGRPEASVPQFKAGWLANGPALTEADATLLARATAGHEDARIAVRAEVERLAVEHAGKVPPVHLRTLLLMGEAQRYFELDAAHVSSNQAINSLLWLPMLREVRRHVGFPEYTRLIGFAALWDAHGPPDACRRVAAGEYRCE